MIAAASAAKPSRRAPRPADEATPRGAEDYTGPQPWIRASPSAKMTSSAATRNATP